MPKYILYLRICVGAVLDNAVIHGITDESCYVAVASIADVLGSLLEAYGATTVRPSPSETCIERQLQVVILQALYFGCGGDAFFLPFLDPAGWSYLCA